MQPRVFYPGVIILMLAISPAAFSESPPQPPFTIHAELAQASQNAVLRLKKGDSVALIVTLTNISGQEQSIYPCARYGAWVADNSYFQIFPDDGCKIGGSYKLAPHNMFPGAIILDLKTVFQGTSLPFPGNIKIGMLPPATMMCDNIVHGSAGQCGDANTSWSNPIPLNP